MRKVADIVMSVMVMVLLVTMIMKPNIVDSAVLLEKKYPGYTDWIMQAYSMYVDDEGFEPYLITYAFKEGFGSVKPEDIRYYLRYNRNIHPELKRISLRFSDETGVEIIEDSAKYGSMDEKGVLTVDGVNIDLSVPLIKQIDDLTRLEREYDERGNLIHQFRKDAEGNGVADKNGVVGYKWEYDGRMITKESNLGMEGELVNRSDYGYAYFVNEYDEKGNLSLTYFYNKNDEYLRMGSSYFHKFLQSLKGKEFIVTIMDEGTYSLTDTLMEDLRELGINSELIGKLKYSFYAVVTKDGVAEDLSQDRLNYTGNIAGKSLEVISSGWNAESFSSIKIDGVEYSKNTRGMNFVVLEDGKVVQTTTIDSYEPRMPVAE